jgi:hypothetical protein
MKYVVVATALLVTINPALAGNQTKPETITILGNTYKIRPDINGGRHLEMEFVRTLSAERIVCKTRKKDVRSGGSEFYRQVGEKTAPY